MPTRKMSAPSLAAAPAGSLYVPAGGARPVAGGVGRGPRAGLGVGRALGLLRARRRLAPRVVEDQLAERAASHRAVPALWVAEGNGRREGDLVGDGEQAAELGLDRQVPHGHDAAEPA